MTLARFTLTVEQNIVKVEGLDLLAPLVAQATAARDEAVAARTSLNDIIAALNAFGRVHKIWLDPSDMATMKQERTGPDAATAVAVGDPIGSIRNKGSIGDWAKAKTDARRPILRQDSTGRYYAETDGTDDFLLLDGVTLDLSKLHLFIAFKPLGYAYSAGIVAAGPYNTSGDNRNDAFALAANSLSAPVSDFNLAMGVGGGRMAVDISGVYPERARVWEFRKTANATPAEMRIDNALRTASGAPTSTISALGTVTAMETATVQFIIGANHGNAGQGDAIQFSATAYYGIVVGDDILTDDQCSAVRSFLENKTYPAPPVYPTITTLGQLATARTTLINEVFSGGVGLPTDLATKAIDGSPFTTVTGLNKVEKLTIPGDAAAKPRLWTPNSARTDVVALIWAGHAGTAAQNGLRDYALQPFITAHVPTVTMVLPDGPNDYTSGDPTTHGTDHPPYEKWARQAVVSINTLLNLYPGAKVIMTGISGGGWATTLCAALDTRITNSVQFVGSLPEFIYVNVDYEQWLTQISANYLDLYLLAAANGRRHIQVLHENDEAGFNRAAYGSRPPYAPGLAAQATSLGGYYDLRWFNYSLHALNADSQTTLLAELP
jgi:hypothetical protein